jgi:hypothetical protein
VSRRADGKHDCEPRRRSGRQRGRACSGSMRFRWSKAILGKSS